MSTVEDMLDYRARRERYHKSMYSVPQVSNAAKGIASLFIPSWVPGIGADAMDKANLPGSTGVLDVIKAAPLGDVTVQQHGIRAAKGAAARFASGSQTLKAEQLESAAHVQPR